MVSVASRPRLASIVWPAVVVLAALVLVPAPMLPPEAIVSGIQALLGCGRGAAYLFATLGLHATFYGTLGILAALAFSPARTARVACGRLLFLPLFVVALAVLVRSLRLGYVPVLSNALVPMVACALGTALGLSLRQHGLRATLLATSAVALPLVVLNWPGLEPGARYRVETLLHRMIEAEPAIPPGDERFAHLLQLAFVPPPDVSAHDAVEHNATAIFALGVVLGHERLARYAGLDPDSDLVRAAVALRQGATLRGREDWPRHYCLSAALAVVESPFVSDLGGLLKEELDALGEGSGFSFADLAADRAGTRFAQAATASTEAALATQARLRAGFATDDYFPSVSDLAENLSVDAFRRDYGAVGAERSRAKIDEIDARLDGCAALTSR